MTFEEAKNQLKKLIQDRKSFICGGDDEIYKKDIESLKMAISAIDRQIPKKPIEKSPWVYHCPRCGQALDWSDTDD